MLIYARKMAAKAARPAMAMELPTVLAAPLNGMIGAPVDLVEALREELAFFLFYISSKPYPVPDAAPDAVPAAAAFGGEPADAETPAGDPGAMGTAVAPREVPC